MVKMILALPKHIDGDKFSELIRDVLRGRYGENSYYRDIHVSLSWLFYPSQSSTAFTAGFCGNGKLSYYEVDAEELDPAIIATIDDVIAFIKGAEYSFVSNDKILPRDWWKPYEGFRTWNGHAYYSYDEVIVDDYDRLLALLNGTDKVRGTKNSVYEFTDEEYDKAHQILA